VGRQEVNIAVDTNIIVRAITDDHPRQSRAARKILEAASIVAVPIPTLCELFWVLSQGYGIKRQDITLAIRRLIASANVAVDHLAAEAGLAHLDAGGDFADGVIAFEGAQLGGETFVSFDKKAVRILRGHGASARLLSAPA
jgi:predicted nucleic-acid-binding protein